MSPKKKSNETNEQQNAELATGIIDASEHLYVKQPAEIEAKLDKIVNSQAVRERECKERLIKKLNSIYVTKRKEIQKKFDAEAKQLMNSLHIGLKNGFKTFILKASKHYENILHTYWSYDLARAQNEFLREYRLILQEKDARIDDLRNRVKAYELKKRTRQNANHLPSAPVSPPTSAATSSPTPVSTSSPTAISASASTSPPTTSPPTTSPPATSPPTTSPPATSPTSASTATSTEKLGPSMETALQVTSKPIDHGEQKRTKNVTKNGKDKTTTTTATATTTTTTTKQKKHNKFSTKNRRTNVKKDSSVARRKYLIGQSLLDADKELLASPKTQTPARDDSSIVADDDDDDNESHSDSKSKSNILQQQQLLATKKNKVKTSKKSDAPLLVKASPIASTNQTVSKNKTHKSVENVSPTSDSDSKGKDKSSENTSKEMSPSTSD